MKKKRRESSIPMLIVILSTVVMAGIIGAFFLFSQSDKKDPPKPKDPVQTEDTGTKAPEKKTEPVETEPRETSGEKQTEPPVTESQTEEKQTEPPVTEPPVTEPPTTEYKPPEKIPTVYDEKLLAEVALPEGTAPDGYIDKLIFFGDSTTYGMKYYKVFGSKDTKQVWTPSSGTLALFRATTDLIYDPNTGEELSLADICKKEKPAYLVMTLGVNGISLMDEAYFKQEYQSVINTILTNSPDTKLILQSMYPVAKSYENPKSINNEKIQNGNKWIVELASANHLPYLNTYSALVGEDGYLPEAYQNGDGMHLNETGFAKIIGYVSAHPLTK